MCIRDRYIDTGFPRLIEIENKGGTVVETIVKEYEDRNSCGVAETQEVFNDCLLYTSPYPRQDQARQQDVEFISASEPQYTFSSPECRHSTLYMEKRAVTALGRRKGVLRFTGRNELDILLPSLVLTGIGRCV